MLFSNPYSGGKQMVSPMKLTRIKKEITQVDLWMKTGIPQWRLSLIERGIVPKAEEAKKIADVLGKEPAEIFPELAQANIEQGSL
jgi:transcriptional regulator with XRE-family HTH domain